MHSPPDSPASHGSSSSNFYGASENNDGNQGFSTTTDNAPCGTGQVSILGRDSIGDANRRTSLSTNDAYAAAFSPSPRNTEMEMSERTATASPDTSGTNKQVGADSSDQTRKRKRIESRDDTSSQNTLLEGSSPDEASYRQAFPGHDQLGEGQDTIQKRLKVEQPLERTSLMQTTPHPLPVNRSELPMEIWQFIFTFVPPVFLGRLLRVNRAFNKCLSLRLDEQSNHSSHSSGALKLRDSESIWKASRSLWCPGMPKPLSHLKEIDIWRLVCGRSCQFCGKTGLPPVPSVSISPWTAGPGESDVRVIWPFSVRSCGPCLMERAQKDLDALLSPTTPSFLLPALPFALITPAMHVVSPETIRSSDTPSDVVMTKYYLKEHIDDVKKELEEVKGMGTGTAEEFMKGLEQRGKDKMTDAARWEQWESNGGLRTINSRQNAKRPAGGSLSIKSAASMPTDDRSGQSTPASSDPFVGRMTQAGSPTGSQGYTGSSAPSQSNGFGLPPRPSNSPTQPAFQHQSHSSFQQRSERTLRDVNEAKANRRAEIERRCMELDPPLAPSLLNHMESFQAAMLIGTPLTDSAWEVLKPRLLAQREVAERRENERLLQTQLLQAKTEERRQQEAQIKEAKEALDREWEEMQKPVRDRIALYADEIIRDQWQEGKLVTKETSPKFAADVLMYVRQKFYTDVAREGSQAQSTGDSVHDEILSGHPVRKLVLENMKWIFDTKIKPITEQFQKELFLCNGCENIIKFYGFEGVVQHYAAKHTNILSLGSVVVHWRAEWPEVTPFHPNPSAAKAMFYRVPTPAQGQASYPLQPPAPYGGYGRGPESGPSLMHPGPSGYPPSQNSFNGPPYNNMFPRQSASYEPPSPLMYQSPIPSYNQLPTNPYPLQGTQNSYGYPGPTPGFNGPNNNYDAYRAPPPQHPVWGSPYPAHYQLPVAPQHGPPNAYPSQVPYGQPLAPPQVQQNPYISQHPPAPVPLGIQSQGIGPQPRGIYQFHLDEVTKNARDVWHAISGIKDLPGSIRIYVVIHHMALRFKTKLMIEPSLAIFTDGLNNNPLMKPIRNLHGLACKACVTNGNSLSIPVPSISNGITGDRKLYTLPSLLSHFQSVHIEHAKPPVVPQSGIETPRLDWKVDMIELPEEQFIANLVNAPGMDDEKLRLIATVFPRVFPNPLPKVNLSSHSGPVPILKEEEPEQPLVKALPSAIGSVTHVNSPHRSRSRVPESIQSRPHTTRGQRAEISIEGFPRFIDSPYDRSGPASEPGEDEYDPHRPAYIEPVRDRNGQVQIHHLPSERIPNRYSERPSIISRKQNDRLRATPPLISSKRPASSQTRRSFQTTEQSVILSGEPLEKKQLKSPIKKDLSTSHQNVSEDGEVGESSPETKPRAEPGSPPPELSDAEKFLNDFAPVQNIEEYQKPIPAEGQREDSRAEIRFRRVGPQVDREMSERRRMTPGESREQNAGGRNFSGSFGENTRAGVIHLEPQNGYSGRGRNSAPVHIYDQHGDDRYERVYQAPTRAGEQSPEPITIRNGSGYIDEPRGREQATGRQQHGRRDRYGSQRFQEYSSRSRSPTSRNAQPEGGTFYRDRSPSTIPTRAPVYRQLSPEATSRRHAEESITYTRGPPPPEYGYVDDARYYDTYGRQIEYVRYAPHDPQPPGTYVIERRLPQDAPAEYVTYEDGFSRERIYEHNGQYYKAEPRYYDERDPRYAPPSGRQVRYQ
ncbi:MAG: hypothetical protein M1834_005117 [Cirrosporium novae-zelandiae]|nr:MAG: hypothetical protein M1834_005117 [Cirrosporium novae-zelandiae]